LIGRCRTGVTGSAFVAALEQLKAVPASAVTVKSISRKRSCAINAVTCEIEMFARTPLPIYGVGGLFEPEAAERPAIHFTVARKPLRLMPYFWDRAVAGRHPRPFSNRETT